MPTLDDLAALVGEDHGLAVVSTVGEDGDVHSSVVNAGVLDHPVTGDRVVGFVARGGAVKLANLRRRPRATIVMRAGWRWVAATGPASLIGPDDPADEVDPEGLRRLLRAVFQAAGGTHDDWETYDRVMAAEHRCVVLIRPERVVGVLAPAG